MLFLTRMPGETIRIVDNIVVSVMGIQGVQVSIGIAAPKSVKVLREELLVPATDAEAD